MNKISQNLHQLKIDFSIPLSPDKSLPRFVNVIIVLGEKIALIDTGVKGSEEVIFNYLARLGRDPLEIDTIVLSHAHPDHIGSAARIKELTGCKVLAHEYERTWIENIDSQESERPVPGFRTLVDRPVVVDRTINPGEILSLGNTKAEVVFLPGHSAGLIGLLFQNEEILFAGDAIPLMNDIPNYDNFHQLSSSLETIGHYIPACTLTSSWTNTISGASEAKKMLTSGFEYLSRINDAVVQNYIGEELQPFDHCRKTLSQLGLPPFLCTPVVDRAFRSHNTK
jgi:hydroxyacylglutathione hydrolase